MSVETPPWLLLLEKNDPFSTFTRRERTRFLVRTVALAYCSDGSITALAQQGMGATHGSVSWMYSRDGSVSVSNAILLEKLSGGIVTREMLRPDIFRTNPK